MGTAEPERHELRAAGSAPGRGRAGARGDRLPRHRCRGGAAMSADNNAIAAEPQQWVTLPGFPDLCVSTFEWDGDVRPRYFRVTYRGWAEDLVAAGIVRRRALAIGPRTGLSRRRTDAQGRRW